MKMTQNVSPRPVIGLMTASEIAEYNTRKNSTHTAIWNEMVGYANAFVNGVAAPNYGNGLNERAQWRPTLTQSPTYNRTPINIGSGPSSDNPVWNASNHHLGIIIAAFMARVLRDTEPTTATTYRNSVRDYLLTESAVPNLNFTLTAWTDYTAYLQYDMSHLQVAQIVGKWVLAYRYIRDDLTSGERATLDPWITNCYKWCHMWPRSQMSRTMININEKKWRKSLTSESVAESMYEGAPYQGARMQTSGVINRTLIALIGAAHGAAIFNDTYIMESIISMWKLYIQYGAFGDACDFAEYTRHLINAPDTAYNYMLTTSVSLAVVADIIYRAGYENLFDYETTLGDISYFPSNPRSSTYSSQPKSLKKAIIRLININAGNPRLYKPGFDGDSTRAFCSRYDFLDTGTAMRTQWTVHALALANRYYQDPLIAQAIDWQVPGAPIKGNLPQSDYTETLTYAQPFHMQVPSNFTHKGLPHPLMMV